MTDLDFYASIQQTLNLLRPELERIYPASFGYSEMHKKAARRLEALQAELDYRVNRARLGLELEER